MDLSVIAAFVAFFAMVLAWLVAPSSVRQPVGVVETAPLGAD